MLTIETLDVGVEHLDRNLRYWSNGTSIGSIDSARKPAAVI
jgi:hypothetical protein